MKRLILLLSLMVFCDTLYAQTRTIYTYDYSQGSAYIWEAEEAIAKGNAHKAEKLIDKAKQADYGFCGNAWFDAYARIHIVEIKLMLTEKKYKNALVYLDSLEDNNKTDQINVIDSMKMVVLIAAYGKERVVEDFNKAEVFGTITVNGTEFYAVYLSSFTYKFRFRKSNDFTWGVSGKISSEALSREEFWEVLTTKSFYPLIH